MDSIQQNQLFKSEITLNSLEHQISDLLKDKKREFYQLGEILTIIKKNRLYKENYSNFGLYCKEKWDLGVSYCNYLVKAYEVISALKPIFPDHLPNSERHLRLFSNYPLEKIIEIWSEVLKMTDNDTSKINLKIITQAIDKIFPTILLTENKSDFISFDKSKCENTVTNDNVNQPLSLQDTCEIKSDIILQNPIVTEVKSVEVKNELTILDDVILEIKELDLELKQALNKIPKNKHKQLIDKLKSEIKIFIDSLKNTPLEVTESTIKIDLKPEITEGEIISKDTNK